jgi:uncharacterized membrane protein YfcA
MLGVAGGELIIPTIVLVFAVDIKLAGSLSLAISVPTILMGLWRYHRKQNLGGLKSEAPFMAWMAAGSVAGAFAGSWLLQFVSSASLHLVLGCVLLVSAFKMLLQRPRNKAQPTGAAGPVSQGSKLPEAAPAAEL